ncbi:MAG TPA: hypothetical protein VGM38_02580 [Pseudolysinimonas sp.]
MTSSATLPTSVATLLDGQDLESRIGVTLLLIVSGDEWPRVASLSVGEVLAVGAGHLMLTLYASSRTSQALAARGRGTLFLVDDGAIVKIQLVAEVVSSTDGRTVFRARVDAVECDEVPYARVSHGIEFELIARQEQVTARWRAQLQQLKELSA